MANQPKPSYAPVVDYEVSYGYPDEGCIGVADVLHGRYAFVAGHVDSNETDLSHPHCCEHEARFRAQCVAWIGARLVNRARELLSAPETSRVSIEDVAQLAHLAEQLAVITTDLAAGQIALLKRINRLDGRLSSHMFEVE